MPNGCAACELTELIKAIARYPDPEKMKELASKFKCEADEIIPLIDLDTARYCDEHRKPGEYRNFLIFFDAAVRVLIFGDKPFAEDGTSGAEN